MSRLTDADRELLASRDCPVWHKKFLRWVDSGFGLFPDRRPPAKQEERQTMLVIHGTSHTDHVSPTTLAYLVTNHKPAGGPGPAVETITLPDVLPEEPCLLHGPACGDAPVPEDEVTYGQRPGRAILSRLCRRPARMTRRVTVITGPYGDHPCVMYTAFAGPPAPRETGDPLISTDEKREESRQFWAGHALTDTAWFKTAPGAPA